MTGAGRRPMRVAPAGGKRRALGSFRASFFCGFGGFLPDAACPIGRHRVGSAHHEWQRSDTFRLYKDERSN
jgi:hypothetical protein